MEAMSYVNWFNGAWVAEAKSGSELKKETLSSDGRCTAQGAEATAEMGEYLGE